MAEPPLAGILGRPFDEQMAALRLRAANLVPTARWDDLWQENHDRAIVVAGAMKADLLADLSRAIVDAGQGGSLEAFRRDFRATVAKHGWHGWTGEGTKAGAAWRTRVICQTNMPTRYAAGRMAQLVEGGFPLWVYRHGASREPRPEHLAWDGLTLPPDHPFCKTHAPPNGWGCSCYILGASSPEDARDLGGDPGKGLPPGWDARDARTGAPPGIDRGWAYAPGRSVAEAITIAANKLPDLPAEIGAAMFASMPARAHTGLVTEFGEFVDSTLSGPPRGERFILGAVKPDWIAAASRKGVRVISAEIAIRDRDVWHMVRDSKVRPLDLEWIKNLPAYLLQPDAVVLDQTHDSPAILLIFRTKDEASRVVLQLNFKDRREKDLVNLIRSARIIGQEGIGSMRGRGFTVLTGKL